MIECEINLGNQAAGLDAFNSLRTDYSSAKGFVDKCVAACRQCPYCVREYPKIKEVVEAYEGKVRLVFKHYPLSFHVKAKPAHAAVELALRQKGDEGFWKMHDMIMAEPKKLEISDLRGYAEELGLDLDEFDRVTADKEAMNELLADDKALARKCKVRGTPTETHGLKLGDRSVEAYKKRIEEIIAKSAEGNAVTKR